MQHKNKNDQRNKRGFTLIELLVAMTISVVLMVIGVVSFTQAGVSARNAKRKTDMETVRQALVLYRSEEGGYPTGSNFTTMVETIANAEYLSRPLPQDPKSLPHIQYSYDGVSNINTIAFCACAATEGLKGNSPSNASDRCTNLTLTTGEYYCVKSP